MNPYFIGLFTGTCLGVLSAAWVQYWYHLQLRKLLDRNYRVQLEAIRNEYQRRYEQWEKDRDDLRLHSDEECKRTIQIENRVSDCLEYLKSINGPGKALAMLENIMDGNIAPYHSESDYPEPNTFNPVTIVTDPFVIDGYLDAEESNG